MNRILDLQKLNAIGMDRLGAEALIAISTCSRDGCSGCSSCSNDGGCICPPDTQMVVFIG
jgi:hypothetical protein